MNPYSLLTLTVADGINKETRSTLHFYVCPANTWT